MFKTTGLSRVFGIFLLVLLTVGTGIYVTPRLAQALTGHPIDWAINDDASDIPLSPFKEQAYLQQAYADTLQEDIVSALEQIAGAGAVQATVRVQLDLTRETQRTSKTRAQIYRLGSRVKNLSVTVLIDGQTGSDSHALYQPRTKTEMAQYRSLVKTIVGYDKKRGDQIEVMNLPFMQPRPALWGYPLSVWINGACFVLFTLGIIGLLVAFVLPMLRALSRPIPVPTTGATSLHHRLTHLCRKHPARVAATVHTLLTLPTTDKGRSTYAPADKAAIVLMTLDRIQAKEIFRHLSPTDIRQIGRRMTRLGLVCAKDVQQAWAYFLRAIDSPHRLQGTPQNTAEFLAEVTPKHTGLSAEIRLTENGRSIWERVAQLDIGTLLDFLKNGDTETAALTLYHLPEDLSGRLLTLLPQEISSRILVHLTHMKRVSPQTRDRITRHIAPVIEELLQQRYEPSGADRIAAIMKTLSRKEKEHLTHGVTAAEEQAGANLKACLIEWDDLARLSDEAMQTLLKYCDKQTTATALTDAAQPVLDAFVRHLRADVWQSMQHLTHKPSASDIESARLLVLKTARELNLFG